VTITVERPGGIAGTLSGFPTTPIVHAGAIDDLTNGHQGLVSGSTFRVTGMRPGRYLVTAQTTQEGDARIIEVRPGRTTELALTARGRGIV
jgi:hypothetical protein